MDCELTVGPSVHKFSLLADELYYFLLLDYKFTLLK